MDLFPFQAWFLFDFTEIIAIEHLPTGQHSILSEMDNHGGEKISLSIEAEFEGQIKMCNNIYLLSQSSFVLFFFFSPSNPLHINSLLLASSSGTRLSYTGCNNMLFSILCIR